MMPIFSLLAIIASLFGESLIFSAPDTWAFTGTVIETRQVLVMGLHAQVALVHSRDFDAWVILRTASQSAELDDVVLGDARSGDQVRVSITGSHVSENGVDWDLCQPLYSNYCRQGWLYDTGPLSGDWYLPVSPSNELIHFDNHNPSIAYPLFWDTEVLKDALALKRDICPQRPGKQSGETHPCDFCPGAYQYAAGFRYLAGQAFRQGCLEPQ